MGGWVGCALSNFVFNFLNFFKLSKTPENAKLTLEINRIIVLLNDNRGVEMFS